MAERLTPELRRQVLNLNAVDKAALVNDIRRSMPHLAPGYYSPSALADMAFEMRNLVGFDIALRCRNVEMVNARTVFCFVARLQGYSQQAIADFLHQHRSTIAAAERRMYDALDMPCAYADVIRLHEEYLNRILK